MENIHVMHLGFFQLLFFSFSYVTSHMFFSIRSSLAWNIPIRFDSEFNPTCEPIGFRHNSSTRAN